MGQRDRVFLRKLRMAGVPTAAEKKPRMMHLQEKHP